VRRLGPNDSAGRSALKQAARDATPPITRSAIQILRPGTGPREGSGGTANRTSASADRLAGRLGTLGRAAGGANVVIGVARVATSDRPAQEAARVGGGVAGAIAGAQALGTVGALGGPWGAGAGAVIGGILGGFGGEALVDSMLGND
jgi:phage tail tape-measure protein